MRVPTALTLLLLTAAVTAPVQARDMDGGSEGYTQEQRDFVRGAHSQNGIPCCDEADGYDVQWFTKDDHYVVILDGPDGKAMEFDVPPEAVVKGPSPLPRARVWYVNTVSYPGGKYIRCFVPGAMY